MESESGKALALRMRQMVVPLSAGFGSACAASLVWMMACRHPLFPAVGVAVAYLSAALVFAIAGSYVCRTTRWFNTLPLLPLSSLRRALHAGAVVASVALFIGSLELHSWRPAGDPLGLSSRSHPTLSECEGCGRWILCSMPLFVAYMLHDLQSRAPVIWWAVSAVAITLSHVLNAFVLIEIPTASQDNASAASAHWDWLLVLCIQLLYLTINYFFAQAALLSIHYHHTQLLQRESALVEQGKSLALQREQAFSTAHVKSQFLANMSHEIRTPLNGVIGLCSLVLESELTVDQRDCLSTAIKSGETLLCIINDILLFSKLESGKLLIECLPFSPVNAVEDVLDIFALSAQQQDNELVPHFKPGIACPTWGDSMRIRQILTNLISNALKFSSRSGEVIVTVEPIEEPHAAIAEAAAAAREAEGDADGCGVKLYPTPVPSPSPRGSPRSAPLVNTGGASQSRPTLSGSMSSSSLSDSVSSGTSGRRPAARRPHHPQQHYPRRPDAPDTGVVYLKFSVQDFGCGIPRNKQHHLFHAFSQVDASDTRKFGGTGLGLVIVARLVELMGGQIGFESEAGRGSTFWFWLPFATRPPPADAAAAADDHLGVQRMYAAEGQTQTTQAASQPKAEADLQTEGSESAAARRKPSLSIDLGAVATPNPDAEHRHAAAMAAAAEAHDAATAAATSAVDAAAEGRTLVTASCWSPSPPPDPSHTFSRYVSRLSGKRLLLVESSPRCAAALGELARIWGMQVTTVHTKAAWESEWHSICLHAYRKQQTRSMISTTAVPSLADSAADPAASISTPCMEAPASAIPAHFKTLSVTMAEAMAGSSVRIHSMPPSPSLVEREGSGAAACAPDAQHGGPLYDVILILDSLLLDDTFAPYAAYNTVVREKDFAGVLRAANGDAPLTAPPLGMPALQLDDAVDVSAQLQASTCTTASSSQHCTPASFVRSLSSMAGPEHDGGIGLAAPGFETPDLSGVGVGMSLPPSIGRRRSRTVASSPLVASCSTPGMPSALLLAASGGTPIASSSVPQLPAFVLLLASTRHSVRLDAAAKEAAGRGIASVLPKPVKWKALLQALLKASNYRPSATVLIKAFQRVGFSPVLSPSQLSRSGGPLSAHRRSVTGYPAQDASDAPKPPRRNNSRDLLSPGRFDHSAAESAPSSAPMAAEGGEQSLQQRRSMSVDGESAAQLPPKHLFSARSAAFATAAAASPLCSFEEETMPAAACSTPIVLPAETAWSMSSSNRSGSQCSSSGSSSIILQGTILQQLLIREASAPKAELYGGVPAHTPQPHGPPLPLASPLFHPAVSTPSSCTSTPTPRPRRATLPNRKTSLPVTTASAGAAGGGVVVVASSRLSPGGTSSSVPPNAHLKILVTEDNLINQKVVLRMLHHLGYSDVTVANDGVECLQLLARHNQHQSPMLQPNSDSNSDSSGSGGGGGGDANMSANNAPPNSSSSSSFSSRRAFDLILMDKSMPRLGGLSTTRRLRAGLCPCFQPRVVALTANVLPADQEACIAAGMQDFIAKPLLLPQLKQMLLQCKTIGPECNYDTRNAQQQTTPTQSHSHSQSQEAPLLPPPPPSYLQRQLSLQQLLASPTQLLSPDSCVTGGTPSPAFSEFASPGPLSASSTASSGSGSAAANWPSLLSPPGPPPPSCVCRVLWSDKEEEEQEE